MKIGIYSPYLNSLGGGERYMLTIASHLSASHDVSLFWDDDSIRASAKKRLGLDLSRVSTMRNMFAHDSILTKMRESKRYDCIFFLSDGSIPYTRAKHNIIHFQNPFPHVKARTFVNTVKLKKYDAVVCNSQFTKKYIDQEYGVDSMVIYPPAPIDDFSPGKKEKLIINVGRFSKYYINKNQLELIEAFRMFHKRNHDWRLVIIGGMLEEDRPYYDELKAMARDLPITLLPNASFDTLKSYYKKATLYWHAAGFGINEKENPAGLEHFGITTVEAMAAGCIPVVYDGGGQKEIVEEKNHGFRWKTLEELVEKSERIIQDTTLVSTMRTQGIARAQDFSEARFVERIDQLIASL